MRIPAYIHRSRHGIYFFRIVVPRKLRETFDGRTEVRRSLHTRKLREAMQVAQPLAMRLLGIFERAQAIMSRHSPTVDELQLLSKAKKGELRDLTTTNSVTLPNGQQHSYTIKTDSDSPAELAAFERLEAKKQAELAAIVQGYQEKSIEVSEAMRQYQEQQQREMEPFRAELRAKMELEVAHTQSGTESSVRGTTDKQTQSRDDESAAKFRHDPENTLSLRWAEYISLTSGVNWTGPRTGPANIKKFEEFKNWWGKDEDIRAINKALLNKFIVYLKSVREVENGPRRGIRGLGERTIDNYTSVLNTFLEWAQEKGYFPDDRKLPTDGLTIVKKSARRKLSAKANPLYTPHQLALIFDPKNYQFSLAHHWWPPLMAIFTGGRRRELCQMLVHDFTVVDGIPALSIDDLGDDDKSIKTSAAKRTIPVHPMLIELGLLAYVEDVKALGVGPELFPGVAVNKYGEKGGAVGTAWGRHVKDCGIVGLRTPTFHSFRATAIDILKRKGVDLDMRCQLVGHEFDHVSENYNPNKFTVAELMKKGVPKLVYDGLDLSGLKYRRNRFDASNRDEAVKATQREAFIEENRTREAKGLPLLKKSDWTFKAPAKSAKQTTSAADVKKPFTIKTSRKRRTMGDK